MVWYSDVASLTLGPPHCLPVRGYSPHTRDESARGSEHLGRVIRSRNLKLSCDFPSPTEASVLTDWFGYALGIAALAFAVVAILVAWRWRKSDHSLLSETQVLVKALGPAVQGIEAQIQTLRTDLKSTNQTLSSIQRVRSGGQIGPTPQLVVRPAATPAAVSARQLRLQQAQALKQQKFRWQQTKDLAKAIGWVLDRLDDEDEE